MQEVAAAGTPHVLNGEVYSVVQVGNTMVLGGTFTSARNDNSQTALPRSRLLAFNANTGQISTTFLPNPNGTVRVVLPAGDGETVYVGGSFTSIGGVARDSLARVRVSDGAVVNTFNAGNITGTVRDLRLSDGRLWLAGAFTHVGGRAQAGITTVNPTTGGTQTYMAQQIAGIHNGGVTQPLKIDISPDGDRLVVRGQLRHRRRGAAAPVPDAGHLGSDRSGGELPDHVLPLGVLGELRHLHARRRLLARRQLLRGHHDRRLWRQRERL